jgi:hypothetical protein
MEDGPLDSKNDNIAQSLNAQESFLLYIMYKPDAPSVWIALSELDWSWSASVTIANGQVQGTNSQQPTPPPSYTPTKAALFPTWVNTTTNYLDESYTLVP